ncbi:MAG: copper homeostasis protein CutC [Treponema sp.]|jgi:copper homeostasis protein|nr:copper homeostasis protein CutC [Treponema sp.]
MGVIREACVETRGDIDGAARGGADRIELCSRLDIGGLTPPPEMVEYARAQKLNVAAMIRRREGFSAGREEWEGLKEDIRAMIHAGADGLVFGYVSGGGLDLETLNTLLLEVHAGEAQDGKRELVFHMAFDELSETAQFAAVDTLAALGFARILTKGGAGRAEDNIDRLKRLNACAQGKITILCGGGVTDGNYERIAKETGVTQFHGRKLAIR